MKGIFVHIPKNAGQSIRRILPPHCACFKHRPIQKSLKLPDFDDRFKFAFVRNPWARMVSLYHFKKQRAIFKLNHPNGPLRVQKEFLPYYLEDDFAGFIKFFLSMSDVCGRHGHCPSWQQKEWLVIDDKISVDFVGKVENIQEDFQKVAEALGIYQPLPWVNKSVHESYEEYYDTESKDLISRAYADDIELFGYRFAND